MIELNIHLLFTVLAALFSAVNFCLLYGRLLDEGKKKEEEDS